MRPGGGDPLSRCPGQNAAPILLLSLSFSPTYQGAKPGVLGDNEEDAIAIVYYGHVRGNAIDFLEMVWYWSG